MDTFERNVLRQRKAFDENEVKLTDVRYKKAEAIIESIPKGTILEIGSSDGEFLYSLKEKGWDVSGLEISEHAAQKARDKGVDTTVHDANHPLPLTDNSMDVIVAGEVIEHLFEDKEFLNECHRVLKQGGTLILTTPNLTSLKNRIFMLFGFNPWYAIEDHHYHVYTYPLIQDLFKRSNFNQSKFQGNFIIYSKNREPIFGSLFEKLADHFPGLAEHFIVIARKD